jgi:cytochrome c556
MPPELAPRLPAAFKQLAQQTHRTFDAIADDAERGAPRDALLARLSENLARCVACHASYRLAEPR